MSDTYAAESGSEPIAPPAHKPGGDGPLTPREAARSLGDWRNKLHAGTAETPQEERADPATPAHESEAQAEDADPLLEAPGETQETDPADDLPPVEPPRSWTKEEKDRFKSFPRETQEYLAQREQERDRAHLQRQNDAAEKLRGLTAKEQAVERARQEYESALPILLNNLQTSYAGEFGDIQSMADVQRLATEDPIRYTRWDAHQKQMAAVQQEIGATQQRQASEHKQRLGDFITKQNELFEEKAPEFKDKTTRDKQTKLAVEVLSDLGFKDNELGQLYRGEANLSLHDHRLQLLIRDAVRYRESESSKAAAAAKLAQQKKPVPQVQRPGTSSSTRGTDHKANIQALQKQLNNATGMEARRIAVDLQRARRAAGMA